MPDIREQIREAVAAQLADHLAGLDLPEGAVVEIVLEDDQEEDDHG